MSVFQHTQLRGSGVADEFGAHGLSCGSRLAQIRKRLGEGGALCWRGRSVAACSFAPRLAQIRKRLGEGGTSETSDIDDRVSDAAAEPSGRDEPLPSVSITELAGDYGQLSRLPRCADGSGRSPGSFGPQALAIAPGKIL